MQAFFVGKPSQMTGERLAMWQREALNPEIIDKALLEFIMIECLDY